MSFKRYVQSLIYKTYNKVDSIELLKLIGNTPYISCP